ncbi:hypothetical protein J2I47_12575 [Fibrella sp. HMF5335]|uniref:Curlin associated repeat-containing protein n=1 Tax=Fibrella rubiginis TaxID=2817060 RepID=A0A939GJ44_9BACT|nr:hypothetical protein [Fibrella rubiginis]MBO0937383.1 hypothetical protein [Fibrella rubiginis]
MDALLAYQRLAFTAFALTTTLTVYAQNSVVISQSGGAGNTASINQSGGGNYLVVNQQATQTGDSSKPGNRVSLRVPKGTQTTINQINSGPNAVEISQDGQATATINQSSATNENPITVLPNALPPTDKPRPAKRRNRQP